MKSHIGRRFSCLVVTEYCHRDTNGNQIWKCLCDCGKKTFASASSLVSGRKQSCGHLRREWLREFRKGRTRARHKKRQGAGVSVDEALEELEETYG